VVGGDGREAGDVGWAVEDGKLGALGGTDVEAVVLRRVDVPRRLVAGGRVHADRRGFADGIARIRNEPVIRLLGSEYAERGVLLESLGALREEIAELATGLDAAERRADDVPHRTTVLQINARLARRILDARLQWLDEVEAEL
jgi:hypothetical protein